MRYTSYCHWLSESEQVECIKAGEYSIPVEIFMQTVKHKRQQFLRIVLLESIETRCILPDGPLQQRTHTQASD